MLYTLLPNQSYASPLRLSIAHIHYACKEHYHCFWVPETIQSHLPLDASCLRLGMKQVLENLNAGPLLSVQCRSTPSLDKSLPPGPRGQVSTGKKLYNELRKYTVSARLSRRPVSRTRLHYLRQSNCERTTMRTEAAASVIAAKGPKQRCSRIVASRFGEGRPDWRLRVHD